MVFHGHISRIKDVEVNCGMTVRSQIAVHTLASRDSDQYSEWCQPGTKEEEYWDRAVSPQRLDLTSTYSSNIIVKALRHEVLELSRPMEA